jgi:stage V sporulation protein S
MAILKVAARSKPTAVAGAIAGTIRQEGRAEVQAIGPEAVNQAVKAVAVARTYLAPENIDIVCIPIFVDVIIEEEERTAIKFLVEKLPLESSGLPLGVDVRPPRPASPASPPAEPLPIAES